MSTSSKNENRYNKPYNDNEDRKILLEVRKGATFSEIAHKLGNGRTAGGVHSRYKYITEGHKKPSNNIPNEESMKIMKLHRMGKAPAEIVHATGWSDRTVTRVTQLHDMAIALEKTENKGDKPMKFLIHECCSCCGKRLHVDDSVKKGKSLYCNDLNCMQYEFSEREYSNLCQEYIEEFCPEEFKNWLIDAWFEKADEEDVEHYEEYEPECDYDD